MWIAILAGCVLIGGMAAAMFVATQRQSEPRRADADSSEAAQRRELEASAQRSIYPQRSPGSRSIGSTGVEPVRTGPRRHDAALIRAITGNLHLVQAAPPDDDPAPPPADGVRFTYVDIYVDAGDEPLAAYQFNLSATAGDVKIVGIEGGEHAAFREPPYYDPQAIQQDRAIIAAFNTSPAESLPQGKTRIARVHLHIAGDVQPQYDLKLTVAASADGKKLPADITLEQGNGP